MRGLVDGALNAMTLVWMVVVTFFIVFHATPFQAIALVGILLAVIIALDITGFIHRLKMTFVPVPKKGDDD